MTPSMRVKFIAPRDEEPTDYFKSWLTFLNGLTKRAAPAKELIFQNLRLPAGSSLILSREDYLGSGSVCVDKLQLLDCHFEDFADLEWLVARFAPMVGFCFRKVTWEKQLSKVPSLHPVIQQLQCAFVGLQRTTDGSYILRWYGSLYNIPHLQVLGVGEGHGDEVEEEALNLYPEAEIVSFDDGCIYGYEEGIEFST